VAINPRNLCLRYLCPRKLVSAAILHVFPCRSFRLMTHSAVGGYNGPGLIVMLPNLGEAFVEGFLKRGGYEQIVVAIQREGP